MPFASDVRFLRDVAAKLRRRAAMETRLSSDLLLHIAESFEAHAEQIAGRMTVANLDIWRWAKLLIKQHGAKAASVVIDRVADLGVAGDREGAITFKRIVEAE